MATEKLLWLRGVMRWAVAVSVVGGLIGCDDDPPPGDDCNNGVLDSGEVCDPGITEGAGMCPTSCEEDSDPCTTVELIGSAAECTATCAVNPASCANGDGCCPDSCNSTNDDDCAIECGNNVTEEGENCDGDCPTSCDDDPCATGTLTGSAEDCSALCEYDPFTDCLNDDGCCPDGCTNATDNDCVGVIGAACTDDSHCNSGMCATEERYAWPGGSCTNNCTTAPTICGSGSHCGVDQFGLRFCLADCEGNDDCRGAEGYECFDQDADGQSECAVPATGSGAIGDACTVHTDCAGDQRGVCMSVENGTVGGYCTSVLCDDAAGACPGGSHCALLNMGLGYCTKDCSSGGDCRSEGYACFDVDGDGQDECWVAGTGSAGIGDACAMTTDCGGGAFYFCFRFWNEGYCTATCTPDIGIDCPAGTNCFDFGDFSSCLLACENDDGCRDGYSCIDGDSQDGNECIGDP